MCGGGPSVRRWGGNYLRLLEAEEWILSITLQIVQAERQVTLFIRFGLTYFFPYNESTGGGEVLILAPHRQTFTLFKHVLFLTKINDS